MSSGIAGVPFPMNFTAPPFAIPFLTLSRQLEPRERVQGGQGLSSICTLSALLARSPALPEYTPRYPDRLPSGCSPELSEPCHRMKLLASPSCSNFSAPIRVAFKASLENGFVMKFNGQAACARSLVA